MLKVVKTGLVLFLVLSWGAGSAFAADQLRTKTQSKKKDGSCQSLMSTDNAALMLAGKGSMKGTGSGDRIKKKDGSC